MPSVQQTIDGLERAIGSKMPQVQGIGFCRYRRKKNIHKERTGESSWQLNLFQANIALV
jgi:hypothetical protein